MDGTTTGLNDLTLDVGNGNITVAGAIGSTTPVGDLIVNSTGNAQFNRIQANSVFTNAGGTTTLGGNVTTTDSQTYNDNVILSNHVTLTGTNLNLLANVSSANSSLTLTNSNLLNLPATTNMNLGGAFVQNGAGAVNLGSNINAASISFSQPVTLTNPTTLTSNNGLIEFLNTLDGSHDLTLSAPGNITFRQGAGNLTPLNNLTITRVNNFLSSSSLNLASLNHTGAGTVNTQNIIANGGNVTFNATGDITLGNVTTAGGDFRPTSSNGAIITGNLNTSAATGGEIFVNARTRIATGNIDTRGTSGKGGDVTLDPIGDITVQGWINSSGTTEGGNVTIISTGGSGVISTEWINANGGTQGGDINISTGGGNFRVFSTIPGTSNSLSTTGGQIIINHDGSNQDFIVGDASVNGTAGTITDGSITIPLNTRIFYTPGETYSQGGIAVTPGGIPVPAPTPIPLPTPSLSPTPAPAVVPTPTPVLTPTPAPSPLSQPEPESIPVPVVSPVPPSNPIALPSPAPLPEPVTLPVPVPSPLPQPETLPVPVPESLTVFPGELTSVPIPDPVLFSESPDIPDSNPLIFPQPGNYSLTQPLTPLFFTAFNSPSANLTENTLEFSLDNLQEQHRPFLGYPNLENPEQILRLDASITGEILSVKTDPLSA